MALRLGNAVRTEGSSVGKVGVAERSKLLSDIWFPDGSSWLFFGAFSLAPCRFEHTTHRKRHNNTGHQEISLRGGIDGNGSIGLTL